ncbi:IclR family transcriptional regulator [Nocardia sp. CA-119907]|uniref:IclR family transcriptional regulator n=1 Tax=Nocardia sp. CA-119907 TaxID=3239973 RepID=UPI003D960C85
MLRRCLTGRAMARNSNGESVFSRMSRIYEAFGPESPAFTVTELSKRSGMPMATVSRMVAELVEHDWLLRDGDGRVRIGFRVWELVTRAAPTRELRRVAMPYVSELHARIGHLVAISVRQGDGALVIDELPAPGAVEPRPGDSGRLPLHASATGLVLLAYAGFEAQQSVLGQALTAYTEHTPTDEKSLRVLLSEVRRSGIAICVGFLDPKLTSISVPLRGAHGEVVAALTVVVPDATTARSLIPVLRAASARVSRALAENGAPDPTPLSGYLGVRS